MKRVASTPSRKETKEINECKGGFILITAYFHMH